MKKEVRRVVRDRRLTPEEAAKCAAIRQAVANDMPEIMRRRNEEGPGPWGWEDLREFQNCVRALRSERERQGLTCEEVAHRAGLKVEDVQALEAEQEFNPRLTVLTRYAHALGYRLALTLALRALPAPIPQTATLSASTQRART